jgi:hypothetical protein
MFCIAVLFAVPGRRSGSEWVALLRDIGLLLSAANRCLPGRLLPQAVAVHSLSAFTFYV